MFFDGKHQRFIEDWVYFIEIENEFDKVVQQKFVTGA